jgi:hypothetical protein
VAFINLDKSSSLVEDLLFAFCSFLFEESDVLFEAPFFLIKEKLAFFFGFSSCFFSSSILSSDFFS